MSKDAWSEMIAVVLGGGRGTRLAPLTTYRSKPAVPLAGKYRLVDVPLSNCINSGIRRIFVLTQFNSASLNRHIANTYKFDDFSGGRVEVLAAEQTPETEAWFQGTADAVRKSLTHVTDQPSSHVLILSGDALYRQNYEEVLQQHIAEGAEITVCCKLVDQEQASDFGIVDIDENRNVNGFVEKPKGDAIPPLKVNAETIYRAGLTGDSTKRPYLASMGIYLFNTATLMKLLAENDDADFGKQLIPASIGRYKVMANLFDGYWEDIGTIRAFFQANLDLLTDNPQFSFFHNTCPIFTHSRLLPSSEILDSRVERAMIAEGCMIKKACIQNSIVGIRSMIRAGARLENVVMMGADYYEEMDGPNMLDHAGMGIGRDVLIRNAIVDKNARIGEGARIVNEAGVQEADGDHYSIKDGIVIIRKNAVILPGTVI
jgi:glucose-1-phosphate adenylyltransferase